MGRKALNEKPMTSAERKREQRRRENRATIEAIGCEESADAKTLLKLLELGLRDRHEESEGIANGYRTTARRAWEEIGRRNGWIT